MRRISTPSQPSAPPALVVFTHCSRGLPRGLILLSIFALSCWLGCTTTTHPANRKTRVLLSSLETALAAFEIDCARYPSTPEGLSALISNPGLPGWRGPYWDSAVAFVDGWGTPLRYQAEVECVTIQSGGRDRMFDTPDDVRLLYPNPAICPR